MSVGAWVWLLPAGPLQPTGVVTVTDFRGAEQRKDRTAQVAHLAKDPL